MAADTIVVNEGLRAVLEMSNTAREQALELVGLVAQGTDATSRAAFSTELAKHQKLLTASIAHLRGLHRTAHFSARDTKAQTAEARQEVDRLHLQLQNLFYEERHLQGEITACESYE